MTAFLILIVLVGAAVGQEAVDWTTGKAFESAARRSGISVYWEQAPLKRQLTALSLNQRVAVHLDRRVDPEQRIDWQAADLTLEQFLWELGERDQLGVAQVGDLFYLGPWETALALSEHITRIDKRLAATDFPATLRKILEEPIRVQLKTPFAPSEWLESDAASKGLELNHLERIPFDWWSPVNWPNLPRYQAYILFLAGFQLTLEIENDDLRIVPLELPSELNRQYALEGVKIPSVAELQNELPDLKLGGTSKRLTAVGGPAAIRDLERKLAKLRRPAAQGEKVFTLKTTAPRGSILASIAQQLGVKLEFPEEARKLLAEPVQIDVQRVTLSQLIEETLRGTELEQQLEAEVLRLKFKPPHPVP